jgi:adenylylsulfate kinase
MRRGVTFWLTGLPAAGKSTIASIIEREIKRFYPYVEILDGDMVRKELTKDLGFTKEDRDKNIARVSYVAKLLTRNAVIVICAFVSPYIKERANAREKIGEFVEVFIKCPVQVCIQRDPKGMYKKALNGEIEHFTGISDPYEEPENPDLIIETDKETPEQSADKLIRFLLNNGYIITNEKYEYKDEEEKIIEKRLKDLGYI